MRRRKGFLRYVVSMLSLLACEGGRQAGPPAAAPEMPPAPETTNGGATEGVAPCQARNAAFNLAVGGVVTAASKGMSGSEDAKMAFDDNIGTKWSENDNPTPWIAYEFEGALAHAVTTYTVTSANGGSPDTDPKSWEFQGSSDAKDAPSVKWTTLDRQTDQTFPSRLLTKSYSFDNATAYHRYRWLVTANGGATGLQIAELQLFGRGTPAFSVDDTVRGSGDNQFQYSSRWEGHTTGDSATKPLKYGLSSSWSRIKDESVTFTFVGSQVSLFGVKHTQHGIVGVSLDGGPETEVDLYGPPRPNTLVFASPVFCPAGRHTLKVRITGTKAPESSNTYGSIDRVMVIP